MKKKLKIGEKYNKEVQQLAKDKLDFGFDSIYFRYAIAIDELGELKERTGENFNRKTWTNTQKRPFYNALEQLTHARGVDNVNKNM